MMKRVVVAIFCCLTLTFLAAPSISAVALTNCEELGIDGTACEQNLSSDGGKNVAGQAINIALGVLGAIAVLIIVIAGFQFALSQGNQEKTKKARQTILYAVVGLVVAIFASVIVNFIIDNFGN